MTLKNIALLVGNSNYKEISCLKNPINDINLVGDALKSVGFDVYAAQDTNLDMMLELCSQFGERATKIEDKANVLFYYAGHAVQENDHNYLLPCDISQRHNRWIDKSSVSVEWIIESNIKNTLPQNRIVIIDACRDFPFNGTHRSNKRGLKPISPSPETIIAYSTSPGSVAVDGTGDNSPYAEALTAQIETPGQLIETIFKNVRKSVIATTRGAQVPWEHSCLSRDIIINQPTVIKLESTREDFKTRSIDEPHVNLVSTEDLSKKTSQEITRVVLRGYKIEDIFDMANKKNPTANWLCGALIQQGLVSNRSQDDARRYFDNAAELGVHRSYFSLWNVLRATAQTPQERSDALKYLRFAGEKGVAIAQIHLGQVYQYGLDGVAIQPVEVFRWNQAAAMSEMPDGQYALGLCYNNGIGIRKDVVEALHWFRNAASNGSGKAHSMIGAMYLDGSPLPRDIRKAIEHLMQGASLGDSFGAKTLARVNAGGIFVPKNDFYAIEWWKKAGIMGDYQAYVDGAIHIIKAKGNLDSLNYDVRYYLAVSADNKNGYALFYLAQLMALGKYGAKDIAGAKHAMSECLKTQHAFVDINLKEQAKNYLKSLQSIFNKPRKFIFI